MNNKKLKLLCISFLSTVMILSIPVHASNAAPKNLKTHNTTNSNITTIPAKMKPGTIIEYNKNIQQILVQDGYKDKNGKEVVVNEAEKPQIAETKIKLPSPKSGMKVYYNSLGEPTKITINGSIYSDNNVLSQKNNSIHISSAGYTSPVGGVTWYTDTYGMYNNNVLGYHDCATDMNYDNCPQNTQIRLTCISTGRLAYYRKNDCGNLRRYNHIVDLRPEAFESFGFPLSQGVFQGRYVHD